MKENRVAIKSSESVLEPIPGIHGSEQVSEMGIISRPPISTPKGSPAIRDRGERSAADPATGAGWISISSVTSPGRPGFGPQLTLSCDSGSGDSPSGFGWSLSIPAITRKPGMANLLGVAFLTPMKVVVTVRAARHHGWR